MYGLCLVQRVVTPAPTYRSIYNNPLINYLLAQLRRDETVRLGRKGTESINNIQERYRGGLLTWIEIDPVALRTIIEDIINLNILKIDLLEKQEEFLKYQKPYYMGKGTLTPEQKQRKKNLINEVIQDYSDQLKELIRAVGLRGFSDPSMEAEFNRVFGDPDQRPEGGTLDSKMWGDHIGSRSWVGGLGWHRMILLRREIPMEAPQSRHYK